MAVKLVLEFRDATAVSRKWTFNNADADVTLQKVKTLMDTMITTEASTSILQLQQSVHSS